MAGGRGPSGRLQPEPRVRHTLGWEMNAADREPLCTNIAPRGGRLQALLLAPPPVPHRSSQSVIPSAPPPGLRATPGLRPRERPAPPRPAAGGTQEESHATGPVYRYPWG